VNLLGRLFGSRRHPVPQPSPADLAAVDLDAMVAVARERGDTRSDDEVMAGLILGAEFMATRHPDEGMRVRAAAASVVATRRLAARVGPDEAARLLAASEGPIDEQGELRRPPG